MFGFIIEAFESSTLATLICITDIIVLISVIMTLVFTIKNNIPLFNRFSYLAIVFQTINCIMSQIACTSLGYGVREMTINYVLLVIITVDYFITNYVHK